MQSIVSGLYVAGSIRRPYVAKPLLVRRHVVRGTGVYEPQCSELEVFAEFVEFAESETIIDFALCLITKSPS